MAADVIAALSAELEVPAAHLKAVVGLLDDGATIPFIARYRKEATGGLDETVLRRVVERRQYLADLEARRSAIRSSIEEQGKLDASLRDAIARATTKTELEDLYAPFRPRRRTRAQAARERGLGLLADTMWNQPPGGSPEKEASRFVGDDVADPSAALAGARDICAERAADAPKVRRHAREVMQQHGVVRARKARGKKDVRSKFDGYVGFEDRARRLVGHRWLALRRGEKEGMLSLSLDVPDHDRLLRDLSHRVGVDRRSPWARQLADAMADGMKRLVLPRAASELRGDLDEKADGEAVEVFADNLRHLLMAAPFGGRPVLGIDPGQRTGCKCAAVDATGRLVAHDTMFLVQGDSKMKAAAATLRRLVRDHGAEAIAIGNGTHGRETERFVRDELQAAGLEAIVVSVNEAGASVYSASELAGQELGEVDLTVRGAVSIARRLQDPLAELVKIDPKSIGVGQYQHDLPPALLAQKLDEVVEDCVNAVGVELNTASAPLLARVAGLGPRQADAIVKHRDARGRFRRREELLEVTGIGAKTYEQAAGFLRIRNGSHPLDASAVHPERYPVVERMARDLGVSLNELLGDEAAIARIEGERYAPEVGTFTVDDILTELRKPGRDPRASFEAPSFRDDVRSVDDLEEGMELQGVVTNVLDFGAFVDIGVKQDGLVHVSELADRYVAHPRDVVAVGDRLTVRVLSVDRDRNRIGLRARQGDGAPRRGGGSARQGRRRRN